MKMFHKNGTRESKWFRSDNAMEDALDYVSESL